MTTQNERPRSPAAPRPTVPSALPMGHRRLGLGLLLALLLAASVLPPTAPVLGAASRERDPDLRRADPARPAMPAAATPEPTESAAREAARPASEPRPLLAGDLSAELLAKAAPDECFVGVGLPDPPGPPCEKGTPKVNQTYLWSLAKADANLWIGTGANVHCLVGGFYLGNTGPRARDDSVCERGQSQLAQLGLVPPYLGDFRPPRVYSYDTANRRLTERSPRLDPRFKLTLGLRSAGAFENVALLAGPALDKDRGINLFAFRADSGAYLGSRRLDAYDDIRKWVVAGGALYTGVLNQGGGGSILRWRGSAKDPFEFEVVGSIDNEVADLAEHDGRLFVTTWSILTETQGACLNGACPPAGLWMSPSLSDKGLTAADAGRWRKVWDVTAYEPDEITARAYGLGALRSFDGYLYWGTLHVPGLARLAHEAEYGEPDGPRERLRERRETHRALSLFRGRDLPREGRVELLYGEEQLPAYSPTDGWRDLPTGLGPPLFGPSGFGNGLNLYAWTMATYRGHLYVGTLDQSDSDEKRGSDLWRFRSASAAAEPVSLDGLGNFFNYGIRTMLADDRLYLGTANPANLRTDPEDDVPEGGWELLSLGQR